MAESTKWAVVGVSTFAQLREADVLITDSGLDDDAQELLGERVGELVPANEVDPVAYDHSA